jgi:hypothetical protein
MVTVPRSVIYGAALAVVGLISFALTSPHFGAGIVAAGVISMMRGFRQEG